MLSGFQVDGGPYIVPLVNSVSFRGKLVFPLLEAGVPVADVDDDGVVLLLLVAVLLHALTTPSASTAMAAVPYLAVRHRVRVVLVVLTCSNLLTSKSFDDPRRDSPRGPLEGVFPFWARRPGAAEESRSRRVTVEQVGYTG